MRRIFLGLWLLGGLLSGSAEAQQWTGTAALTISGGHQTNIYLDPVLHSWDLLSDPAFAALTPQVGLVRDARRTRLHLMTRARLYPRRPNTPQFAQGHARGEYQLSSSWTVGSIGGATRYRFAASRDSWWALPFVEWTPTSSSTLAVQGGLMERYVATDQGTSDRQASGLVSLRADTWLTDRLQAEGRLYWSDGHTSFADADYSGTGVSIRGTYWPSNSWSFEVEAAAEQLRYERTGSTSQDRIGRGGLKTQWRVRPSVTLFAQTRASAARRADQFNTDVHVSAGIRLQAHRVLGGTTEPSPRRRVCRTSDDGIRVEIPYDGSGTPHLTGDFNGWSLPGIPMTQSDTNTWTTTLSVPSGEYAYRIRVVSDADRRWLTLPSYAQTTDDAFGGTNGVCTVH